MATLTMQQYAIVFGILVAIFALLGFFVAKIDNFSLIPNWLAGKNKTTSTIIFTVCGALIGAIIAIILYFIPNCVEMKKKDVMYAAQANEKIISPSQYLNLMKGDLI